MLSDMPSWRNDLLSASSLRIGMSLATPTLYLLPVRHVFFFSSVLNAFLSHDSFLHVLVKCDHMYLKSKMFIAYDIVA